MLLSKKRVLSLTSAAGVVAAAVPTVVVLATTQSAPTDADRAADLLTSQAAAPTDAAEPAPSVPPDTASGRSYARAESVSIDDEASLAYGASVLPAVVLPAPAAGYGPWSEVSYALEGANAPVTAETLPKTPAGSVVAATAWSYPDAAHFGAGYSHTVRFIVQKAPVSVPDGAFLVGDATYNYDGLADGFVNGQLALWAQQSRFIAENAQTKPQDYSANGYEPWDEARLTMVGRYEGQSAGSDVTDEGDLRRFIEGSGRSDPAPGGKTAGVRAGKSFTISYEWKTSPDANHTGKDLAYVRTVTFSPEPKFLPAVNKGFVQDAFGLVDGAVFSLRSYNQFGAVAYRYGREGAAVVGEPALIPLAETDPLAAIDGNSYPSVVAASDDYRGLYRKAADSYFFKTGGKDAIWAKAGGRYGIGPEYFQTVQSNPYSFIRNRNRPYVSANLVAGNPGYAGFADFDVFDYLPARSVVAKVPLAKVQIKAATADEAYRLYSKMQLKFTWFAGAFKIDNDLNEGPNGPSYNLNELQRLVALPNLNGPDLAAASLGDLNYFPRYQPFMFNTNDPDYTGSYARHVNPSIGFSPNVTPANIAQGVFVTTFSQYFSGSFDPANCAVGQMGCNLTTGRTETNNTDWIGAVTAARAANPADGGSQSQLNALFNASGTKFNVGTYAVYRDGVLSLLYVPYINNLSAPIRNSVLGDDIGYMFQADTVSAVFSNDYGPAKVSSW